MAELFRHARSATTVDDPGGYLRDGAATGHFRTPNPAGPDASAVTTALAGHGPMPLAGVRWLGLSTPQLVIGGVAVILAATGCAALAAGSATTAAVFLVLAVLLAVITGVSARRRRASLAPLYAAWDGDWLRFAPARVGAVWLDHSVRHGPAVGPKEDRGRNQDVRHYFRAGVRVFPTDGSAPFDFTTAPFQALATRDGEPHGLRTAPSPVDAGEPEYANGWTVARYVTGVPEASATLTTNLSTAQIEAALAAADIR
jgi:hypothetical protein